MESFIKNSMMALSNPSFLINDAPFLISPPLRSFTIPCLPPTVPLPSGQAVGIQAVNAMDRNHHIVDSDSGARGEPRNSSGLKSLDDILVNCNTSPIHTPLDDSD